jgi:hypothetical protein
MRVEKYNAVRYLYTLYDFSFRLARFSRFCFFRWSPSCMV